MKRQFLGRLLSLFLVGTVVAGVGCKDYDDDITSLNNRIDELTTGQIASVEKQMHSLQNAVDRLDGVDSGLKDEIEALQGKAETQAGEIGKLQEELGKAASASEVEALKNRSRRSKAIRASWRSGSRRSKAPARVCRMKSTP